MSRMEPPVGTSALQVNFIKEAKDLLSESQEESRDEVLSKDQVTKEDVEGV